MEARILTRITIKAAPHAVFHYLENTRYHYLWNPQMRSITQIAKLSKGAVYETESLVLGIKVRAKNIITEFITDKELEMRNSTGMVEYCANFRLSKKTGATLLTCTTVVSTQAKAFAFAKPVLTRLARRELQTDLQALKIAVEHELS